MGAMRSVQTPDYGLSNLYITGELDGRPASLADYRQEMLAIQELAVNMVNNPEGVLPRFVDLAMEITGGVSAGISLYEGQPPPGVFRWRYLRGSLAPFEGATTPRNFSPYGVTLDQNGPVLCLHPERAYDWIADAGIVVPEVLLVPLHIGGATPLGTLWIVSDEEGHFNREHARAMTELAAFVGIALRMLNTERLLQSALQEQQTLAKEMSHRVKNIFAITDGLVRLSARSASDKDGLAKALSGRLHALASAHALVSRNLRDVGHVSREGDVGALIEAVVLPHDKDGEDVSRRFRLDGPRVACGDHAMNGIALVFHELTTNAAKYGSLSTETGHVDVRWREDGSDLVLSWAERDGPRLTGTPAQSGFGSLLMTSTVANQLGGRLAYNWNPDGLQVVMHVPLDRLAA